MLGDEMGDTISRVSLLMAALFFLASSVVAVVLEVSGGMQDGGGGDTLLSEDTLTCVDEGESSRFLASSFNTEAAVGLIEGTNL